MEHFDEGHGTCMSLSVNGMYPKETVILGLGFNRHPRDLKRSSCPTRRTFTQIIFTYREDGSSKTYLHDLGRAGSQQREI
jgi:hypothetical protein